MPDLRTTCTLLLFGGALVMLPPSGERLREFASWPARPARLPFIWQALDAAQRSGDGREAFARGQQLLDLVPSWTIGHAAIAYRYALTQDVRGGEAAIADQAAERLFVALAWLERAREHAGRREYELLHSAAFLPRIACRQFPGLEQRLPPGGAAAITDAFFAEAEALFPSPAVREQRLFHFPTLAAALLDAGQRQAAVELLRTAIERVPEVRDRELATEWCERVREVVRRLTGDPSVDLRAVFDDPRFEPLWPHLR
ncbi:MAG: hypothetical protein KAI24_18280 [Planctomycetes bacterium]|nr:hypothetical protein [Planctomycetota bacterium]